MAHDLSFEEAEFEAIRLRVVLRHRRRQHINGYLRSLAASFPDQVQHARAFYAATHVMPWDVSLDALSLSSEMENLREMYYVHPTLTAPRLEDVAPETYAFLTACQLLAERDNLAHQPTTP